MKVQRNSDTAKKNKPGEAYQAQDKAPKKGVKADDADEYQARGSQYDKSVSKSKAYASQDKAPQGRGARGPSQADGGPIKYWDKSVEKSDAYEEQCKWGDSDNNQTPSLGFKLGEGSSYLGHFAQEKFLREGHNDGGLIDSFTSALRGSEKDMDKATADVNSDYVSPNKKSGDESSGGRQSAQDSMRKAFNYGSDD